MTEHEVLELLGGLLRRAAADERENPVTPYRSADELRREIDLPIVREGKSLQHVFQLIEQVVRLTPRTSTRRFFNQLFGGRLWPATATDMLASFLNNSMYTFKVAGVQVLIEQEVLRRMREAVGYPDGDGTFAPGGSLSNLVAMMVARNEKKDTIRNAGMDGRRYIVYTSDQSHYSITKNAGILGLGRDNVRKIETDDRGKMIPDRLRKQIAADRQAGGVPMLVNATAGTTVLGAYDPIDELAAVGREHGLWLHVDGAWGGTALLSAKTKHLLADCTHADSFTWDAHKMMGVPLIASAILLKRRGLMGRHFSEAAGYLFQSEEESLNPGLLSIQCGRRNDAFKVWAAWQYYGDEGYEARVDKLLDLARHAAERISHDDRLELLMQPELVNVCFQVVGRSSKALCEALDKRALLKVGYASFKGHAWIRMVCADPEMTFGDIDAFFDTVLATADEL